MSPLTIPNNFLLSTVVKVVTCVEVITPAVVEVAAGRVILFATLTPVEIVVFVAAIATLEAAGVTAPKAKFAVVILSSSVLSVEVITPARVDDAAPILTECSFFALVFVELPLTLVQVKFIATLEAVLVQQLSSFK